MSEPTPSFLSPAAVADLRVGLGAEVVVHPHDPRYAALAAGSACAAVVVAPDAETVARALPLAAAHDLEVEVPGQGTRPARAGSRPRLLLRLTGPHEVVVHPQARTATVGATATWHDLLRAAASHGLVTAPSDDLASSVVADVLLGSTGPLSRALGGCADPVRRLEVVDRAGAVRDVGPLTAPELFRTLRGGGGAAAADAGVVVTRLVLGLVPDPGGEEVVTDLPLATLDDDLASWWAWSLEVPEAVDTSVVLVPGGPGTLRVLRSGPGAPVAPGLPVLAAPSPLLTRTGSLVALLLDHGPSGPRRRRRLAGPTAAVDHVVTATAAVRLRRLGGAAGRPPLVPDGWRGRGATHALDADVAVGADLLGPGWWDPHDRTTAAPVSEHWRRTVAPVASRA